MLYDPKRWDKPKADPFQLETLIAWLETQNPTRSYPYESTVNCLLAQYFVALGHSHVTIGPGFVCFDGKIHGVSTAFLNIAYGDQSVGPYGRGRTFGEALARAREALQRQNEDVDLEDDGLPRSRIRGLSLRSRIRGLSLQIKQRLVG